MVEEELPTEGTQEEKAEKKEIKQRKTYKPFFDNSAGVYESIIFQGKPAFLSYLKPLKQFVIAPLISAGEEVIQPLAKVMFPYRPVTLDEDSLQQLNVENMGISDLFARVLEEYNTFLDIGHEDKVLNAVQTLESYIQSKPEYRTTSYLYYFGGNDSGKTRILEIHDGLDYRPLLSMSLPAADVYSYLGYHDEAVGTILEDEAEDLGNPRYAEKMKLYRAGYRKGKTVPRIEFSKAGYRIQRFFKAFNCKVFDGLHLPNDKGFCQRAIGRYTVKGDPVKDEILAEDLLRFDQLRAQLFAWKMRTLDDPLPEINTSLRGRLKELWKPKLQAATLVGVQEVIETLAAEAKQEKEEELSSSFEAFLSRAVIQSYLQLDSAQITFEILWDNVKNVVGGQEIDGSISCSDFGEITKNYVGRLLKSVCGGKAKRQHGVRIYFFKLETLQKLAKKYHLSLSEGG